MIRFFEISSTPKGNGSRHQFVAKMQRTLEQLRFAQQYFRDQNKKKKIENPIKDWDNPLEAYNNLEFRRKFRFSKSVAFHVLLPIVFDSLNAPHGLSIPPLLQLIVALRWMACNSFQHVVADTIQISRSSVCIIVGKVARAFAEQRARFVYFPNVGQAEEEKRKFQRVAGFPGVIGCIDCTHIKITKPVGEAEAEIYRNRKGVFSINVQAVCNSDLSFSNIVARWPGSVHDSRIFQNSRLGHNLREGDCPDGHLLGDGGYESSRFMLIPYRDGQVLTPAQRRYNKCHIATRNLIERAFGVLKKRFYCLGSELRTHLKNSLPIIICCFVLHNIAIRCNQPLDLVGDENGEVEDVDPEEEPAPQNRAGDDYRQQFTQAHFYHPHDDDDEDMQD